VIWLLKYWRLAAYGAVLAILAGGVLWVRHGGYKAGVAAVEARLAVDRKAVKEAGDKAIAAAQAAENAALANNVEVIRGYNETLVAIAADRDSLAGRVRDYQNRLRTLAANQATDRLAASVAGRIASSAAEVDRLSDELDAACRRDAAKLTALQDQIKPQL